jgi:hypothetical protein
VCLCGDELTPVRGGCKKGRGHRWLRPSSFIASAD